MSNHTERILDTKLSLVGKWNNETFSYFFYPSNQVDIITAGLPTSLVYDIFIKDDMLYLKITNDKHPSGLIKVHEYRIDKLSQAEGLVLINSSGSSISFQYQI